MKGLILKLGLIGLGALTLSGCSDTPKNEGHYSGSILGYDAQVLIADSHTLFSIEDSKCSGSMGGPCGMFARDWKNDGRFDVINIRELPLGHPLEKFADNESLKPLYHQFMAQQK